MYLTESEEYGEIVVAGIVEESIKRVILPADVFFFAIVVDVAFGFEVVVALTVVVLSAVVVAITIVDVVVPSKQTLFTRPGVPPASQLSNQLNPSGSALSRLLPFPFPPHSGTYSNESITLSWLSRKVIFSPWLERP